MKSTSLGKNQTFLNLCLVLAITKMVVCGGGGGGAYGNALSSKPLDNIELLQEQSFELSVPKGSKPYYLRMKSYGSVAIEISNSQTQELLLHFQCDSLGTMICPLITRKDLLENKSDWSIGTVKYPIKIILKNSGQNSLSAADYEIWTTDQLKVNSMDLTMIQFPLSNDSSEFKGDDVKNSNGTHQVSFLLDSHDYERYALNSDPNVPKTIEDTRVIFSTKRTFGVGGVKDDISKSSFLRMRVFSMAQSSTHPVHEISTNENSITEGGSIVTVQSAKNNKCISSGQTSGPKQNCDYIVIITAKDTAYATFQTSYLPSRMSYAISPNFRVVDQVQSGHDLEYEITLSQELMMMWESKPNWQFILIPIEGDPDLEINGDVRPATQKPNAYQFSSVAVDAEERVIITSKKCEELKIGCQKFFLRVSTTQENPASFLLFASASPRSDQIALDLNTPYNGSVTKGEIVNFIVQINPDFPQKLRAHVDLVSNPGGNADLYVMDCADRASCFID